MKYRIKTIVTVDSVRVCVQFKYKYWPFWFTSETYNGFTNWFPSMDEAKEFIDRLLETRRNLEDKIVSYEEYPQ